jgi:hypothetical protein
MPRGLRFARCNTYLLSENMIEQGGFAYVRPADNGNKSTVKGGIIHGVYCSRDGLFREQFSC